MLTPYLLNHTDSETFVSAGGLRGIVADLPEWCKRPGYETSVWLNGIITQLWPHLSTALSDKIGAALGKILAKITPLGISLSFREFKLGNESLNVLSVRKARANFKRETATSGDDEVVLDLDIRWCGDPTLVLDVVIMGLTLQVRLSELQLLGPLRIVLGKFDDKLPCFHMMKVAFVDQPQVDFALSLVGGDIEMFPGVKESITEIIAKGLSKALVWPKYIKIPIANKNEKAGVSKGDAGAVLEVTLVKGNNLKNVRAFGKSDPFVNTRITGSQRDGRKSSVVVGSLNPKWNETFKLIIDDPHTQSVSLAVCDYSAFSEDAGVKKVSKTLGKISGALCGWTRRVRRRVYNIGGVKKSYKKGAKLERQDTEKEDSGSLFQTTMGTGRVNLKNLKPFQDVAQRVILTKSAYSIMNDGGGYDGNDPRRRKALAAGTLDLRLRLIPLSADVNRTKAALASSGEAAKREMLEQRAVKGVVDKKGFVKKMLEKFDPNETDAERAAKAAKAEAKRIQDDVEYLVSSVLGGELDGVEFGTNRKSEKKKKKYDADIERLKPHLYGLLHVTLVRGEQLVSKDTSGSSDPYFKLKLKTQKWKSQTARQTLNPTFDASTEFFVTPDELLTPGVSIKLECWDEDIVGKDFMGEADVPLRAVVRKSLASLGEAVFERVELKGVTSGAAHFMFRFQPMDASVFYELNPMGEGGEDEQAGHSETSVMSPGRTPPKPADGKKKKKGMFRRKKALDAEFENAEIDGDLTSPSFVYRIDTPGSEDTGKSVRFSEEAQDLSLKIAESPPGRKKLKKKTLKTTELPDALTTNVEVKKPGCFACFGEGKKKGNHNENAPAEAEDLSSEDDDDYEVDEQS